MADTIGGAKRDLAERVAHELRECFEVEATPAGTGTIVVRPADDASVGVIDTALTHAASSGFGVDSIDFESGRAYLKPGA